MSSVDVDNVVPVGGAGGGVGGTVEGLEGFGEGEEGGVDVGEPAGVGVGGLMVRRDEVE